MTDARVRDVLDAAPGWWLGQSGRWEYQIVGNYDCTVQGRRVSDALTIRVDGRSEMFPNSNQRGLRRLRREIRRMEREERKMP